MRQDVNSFYILQVSDFHISEDSKESAEKALTAVINKINDMKINIRYLIHTGDMINSSDIEKKINEQYGITRSKEEYDAHLEEIVTARFKIAEEIMKKFKDKLDVMQKNIVICCGNHDKTRYETRKEDIFTPFQEFLKTVCSHTELTGLYKLDDINVLVLNTNISDDKKVTCVDCENIKSIFNVTLQDEHPNWFYTYGENANTSEEETKVNVIVAHQPLYDICEHIRLPYGSEIQTTDFLSALQDFINGNGIYLCGDKHTSSIAASYIHDIAHYFCGHPFVFENNNLPSGCVHKDLEKSQNSEIDYNLIEVRAGKVGQVRKIHLEKKGDGSWKCQVHPIDAVVSNLYEKSRKYIVKNTFAILATQSGTRYSSWTNLSWRNLFHRLDKVIIINDLDELSAFYRLFCRLKDSSNKQIAWSNHNIFYELCQTISSFMYDKNNSNLQNIINVRGDYSCGKSTFLGLLYLYLLYRYSYGQINYIPAYFNMENDDILNNIQAGNTYAMAVKQTFGSFVEEIENIARVEHTSVCYIIDGLDEQDIWSESSQDSIGRVALDILEKTNNSKYIMSFCQNKLAHFKNTMPTIKYYEKSYVMYFNSISVKEKDVSNSNFGKFVDYIICSNKRERNLQKEDEKVCSAIRKLRRLSINPGFIYHNYQYLKECKEDDSIDTVYMMYIDQQHQICLDTLGYNFVYYAPAIAYLFTYEGYTYDRFKAISPSTTVYWEQQILKYAHKMYKAFIFIKKHKDAREYLLALHYNAELCYFAENPKKEIPESSIINKLIPRNISVIIKKLWRTDQNKFVIVCRNLIEKRKRNDIVIHNCTLSMLIYILAYLDKIPDYVRDELQALFIEMASSTSQMGKKVNEKRKNTWKISGENSERMKMFVDLSFLHSQKILNAINSNSSFALVKELLQTPSFALYNRQYMMWYYGDLTIYGESRMNNLVPGEDQINKGMDYYNCFNTLYHKIYAHFENGCKNPYPLLEYDLFTILDLVYSRQVQKNENGTEVFRSSLDKNELEICTCINILDKYINHYCKEKDGKDKEIEKNAMDMNSILTREYFEKILVHLKKLNIKSDEIYVHCFLKEIRQLFLKLLKKNESEQK